MSLFKGISLEIAPAKGGIDLKIFSERWWNYPKLVKYVTMKKVQQKVKRIKVKLWNWALIWSSQVEASRILDQAFTLFELYFPTFRIFLATKKFQLCPFIGWMCYECLQWLKDDSCHSCHRKSCQWQFNGNSMSMQYQLWYAC